MDEISSIYLVGLLYKTPPAISTSELLKRLRHEDSLLPPNRVVLDVDPGPPYAAGNRN